MEALKTESNDFRRDANQSVEEMAQQLAEIKPHRRSLFASDDDSESKREYIRGLIAPAIDSVALSFPDFRPDEVTVRKGKVNLSDLSEVGAAAYRYLKACEMSGTIPSFALLCAAMGYGRTYIYSIMQTRKGPVTDFLSVMQTVFAGLLETATVARRCSEAGGIFILKNSGQGYADRADLTVRNSDRASPFDEQRDPEEIAKKYLSGIAGAVEESEVDC